MSDFSIEARVLRSEMSSALAYNEEQAAWVLADFATRVSAKDIAAYVDGHLHDVEADAEEIAKFYEDFAKAIRQAS